MIVVELEGVIVEVEGVMIKAMIEVEGVVVVVSVRSGEVTGVGLSDVVILRVRRVYFTNTDEVDGLVVCSISEDPIGKTELAGSNDAACSFFFLKGN